MIDIDWTEVERKSINICKRLPDESLSNSFCTYFIRLVYVPSEFNNNRVIFKEMSNSYIPLVPFCLDVKVQTISVGMNKKQ